ncbi:MAG: helix-turn-helix transcriptional regulator [Myxococcales bacterium]|nr:helix-turn-helix transcriptional regulator [Myxococcales bacterium]
MSRDDASMACRSDWARALASLTRRVTRTELATALECSRTHISQLLYGRRAPSPRTLRLAAERLGLDPADAFERREQPVAATRKGVLQLALDPALASALAAMARERACTPAELASALLAISVADVVAGESK